MHRVKIAKNLEDDPLPADYFDLIGGTSTGGYDRFHFPVIVANSDSS